MIIKIGSLFNIACQNIFLLKLLSNHSMIVPLFYTFHMLIKHLHFKPTILCSSSPEDYIQPANILNEDSTHDNLSDGGFKAMTYHCGYDV